MPSAKYCLFKNNGTHLSEQEIDSYLEEGHFYMARDMMNTGNKEEAIHEFEQLSTADASYYQAQVSSKSIHLAESLLLILAKILSMTSRQKVENWVFLH